MPFDPQQLIDLRGIAFDVDGVLTDGSVTWSVMGDEARRFGYADIMGVSLLRRLGIKMALISGEDSPLVDRYAAKMHLPFVVKGTRDKATALKEFAAKFELRLEEVCYFGDDVNDLPAMEIAGLCACPSDAVEEVREFVAERGGYVSALPGGKGAVRWLVDDMLAARKLRGRDVFLMRAPE